MDRVWAAVMFREVGSVESEMGTRMWRKGYSVRTPRERHSTGAASAKLAVCPV